MHGKMWCFLVLFFLQLILDAETTNANPIVTTEFGKIEGFNYETPKGFKTEIFLGIPFAQPPINELRFEKPLPPKPWTTPFQAKSYGFPCATYPDKLAPNGIEDCLTLNIIKPVTASPNSEGYPIMVWIHGGAFLIGSSADYNYTDISTRMVSKGIIFISINYRLGPFGFFSTGDSNAPGNYGLWDQIQALKFIQKIIKNFGGNPKAVTIFGVSAGGASISWLTMASEAEGLFSRAIPMSGSALSNWAHTDEVLKPSTLLGEAAGCTKEKNKNVKECLKTKTTEEIKNATSTFAKYVLKHDSTNLAYFHPRIDGEFLYAKSFDESIKKAPKIEIFMGSCSQEHIVFALSGRLNDPSSKYVPIPISKAENYSREDFVETVHHLFGTHEAFGSYAFEAAEKIINFYEFQQIQQKISYNRNFYLHLYAQLFSDINFNIASIREARKKVAAGFKVYYYVYNFVPEKMKHKFLDGAAHASELSNFFGSVFNIPALPLEGEVAKVQETMVDLFINFAKFGKPTTNNLNVPQIQDSNISYVEINAESKIMNNLWSDRIEFWDNLAMNYGFDWIEVRKIEKHDEL